MNSIQLEVGKTYITRSGCMVKIIAEDNDYIYRFISEQHGHYNENGQWNGSTDTYDIVGLYIEPDIQKQSKARHKHADMIIAWANGAEIEVNDAGDDWYTARYPTWVNHLNYRIKPEPVKTTRYLEVTDSYAYSGAIKLSNSNVKAEFIDGKLVSIELIKD